MKIITRYLMKEVYSAMIASMVVLLFVFLSNVLVRFMNSAAEGVLTSQAVKLLMLLQLPILSSILLPASLFIGVLLAYGRLYADNEMTVLTVCGMTPRRLLATNIFFAFIVAAVVAILSLLINPNIYRYSDHITTGAASSALDMIKPNHFNEIANGKWIFYVESISSDRKNFYNVFAAEQPNKKNAQEGANLRVVTANSAYQKTDSKTKGLYLVLKDGYRYVGEPGQKEYEVIKYGEYGLQIEQETKPWYRDESSYSTGKLWRNRHDNLAMAELQWRLSLPLSALILILIGLPISRVKPRRGRYARIAPAILLYIVYANFLFLARTWVKRGVLSPILGVWWVHALMLLIAIFLIGCQMGWWRRFGISANTI